GSDPRAGRTPGGRGVRRRRRVDHPLERASSHGDGERGLRSISVAVPGGSHLCRPVLLCPLPRGIALLGREDGQGQPVHEAVTAGNQLPIDIDAAAISSLKFSFAKLEGPLPATEAELKAWLARAGGTPSHELTLPVSPGKSQIRLPLREPGGYRVTAEAGGLS